MVEVVSPPITIIARGPAMKPPALLNPTAMGTRARMVAFAIWKMIVQSRRCDQHFLGDIFPGPVQESFRQQKKPG
jgi:hypothetical protein